ncbi:MAG: hypothetical protein ACYDC6_02305 [Acidobacteriaceae bacterium]
MPQSAHTTVGGLSPTRRKSAFVLLLSVLAVPVAVLAQMKPPQPADSSARTRQVLAAAVHALGGEAWLDLRTLRTRGKTAAFFQGTPTGAVVESIVTRALPDRERIDFIGKGRIVQIYGPKEGWEVTYKGKKEIPKQQMEDHRRWQQHSLGTALRQWLHNPATVLVDEGQTVISTHLADSITLIGPDNDAITLELDAATHLPIRLNFSWRDLRFHDKNNDGVEYDNYRTVAGIATPFTVTRKHNGQTVYQRYMTRVEYNVRLPQDFFDAAVEAKRRR